MTNVSAGNQANVGSPKLFVYCAGLMVFVPSLMGMPTSATLSLCAGKNSRRDNLSNIETTEKTSNRKKKKLADSDKDYVIKKSFVTKSDSRELATLQYLLFKGVLISERNSSVHLKI